MPSITLSGDPVVALRTDALVVPVGQGARGPLLVGSASAELDAAFDGRLVRALTAVGATGKREEVVKLASLGAVRAPLVVAVGLGPRPRGGYPAETLRRAAGAAVRALAGSAAAAILGDDDPAAVEALAEGALLGAYAFTAFRSTTDTPERRPLGAVTLLTPLHADRALRRAVKQARVVAEAVDLARDLVNTPPSALHPRELADAAVAAARSTGLEVTVLDEKALKRQGYGGIIAVGQGSVHPPRLVQLVHTHPRATRSLAFVGKGITFDSGGLSLKPPTAMETMKSDMGGAAAVIAALSAIARLNLPVNVTGWAALAENLPSGTAQRPSDVYTAYSGTTVEVLNTDAEGRLVLADAIARACEDSPDLIVDAATLTGAQLVALGARTSGVMGNDDAARDSVVEAAGAVGEAMWPMTLPEELRASLDSEVADLKNIGERFGGMMTAAAFLGEFVADGVPWVHLDIAGPAFNEGAPFGYTPKGGTGAAVRTFVELARRS